MSTISAVAVPVLTARASRINDAHKSAVAAGRSMLAYAIEAGKELIEVKKGLKHGEFGSWCEANLTFTLRHAQNYMRLAKSETDCAFDPALGVKAAIEALVVSKAPSVTATLTPDDAQRILKLARMANGGNVHEESVAQEMLDRMASRFGMTGEEAQAAAGKICPEPPTVDEMNAKAREFNAKLNARVAVATAEIKALIEKQGVEEAVITLAHTLIRLKFPKDFADV